MHEDAGMEVGSSSGGEGAPQPHNMHTPLLATGRPPVYDRAHMRSRSGEFLRDAELDDAMGEGSWFYEITTNYRKLKNSNLDLKQSWLQFRHKLRTYDRDMLKRDLIAGVSSAGLLLPGG